MTIEWQGTEYFEVNAKRQAWRWSFALLATTALCLALPAKGHAATAQAAPAACEQMKALNLPGVTIVAAEVVEDGKYAQPDNGLARMMQSSGMNLAGHVAEGANKAFCRVSAILAPSPDSVIHMEVWLPVSGWNGKYLGVGNFGWAGSLMTGGMQTGISEGYATASTDTGHDTQGGTFAIGHPEKLVDYAYRADHLMTVDAKAIITAFYGRPAAKAYWIGCSLGGLEGLIEAKRYPTDYDGIVVGAPPNPIINFNAEQLYPGWLFHHDPSLTLPKDKATLIHDAVFKACGTPVGQAQGFIEQPDACGFQPEQLLCRDADAAGCLTAAQVDALEKFYRGPVNPRTGKTIFVGPAKGNEDILASSADGRPFGVALDMFKVAFQDPNWDWSNFDWDRTVESASAAIGPLMHVDADLKPYFDHGGKLIFYIGWKDGHNPEDLIGYYKAVASRVGPKDRGSMRLFTIPGMGHCAGGPGCDTFNKLGVIDAWVTKGVTPERIVASKVADGAVVRTRPLCAYPAVATFKGGDMNDAANFACVAPAS